MNARITANQLSKQQRDCLTAHYEHPQPVRVGRDFATAHSLMYRGLLRGDTANRPRFTHLTEEGHEVHCFILGDYADALIRAEEARVDRLAMSDIKDASEQLKPKRDRLIERLLELAAGHQ